MGVEVPACFLSGCDKDSDIIYKSSNVNNMLLRWVRKCLTSESDTGGAEELAVGASCGNGGLRGHGVRDIVEWIEM